MLKDREVEIRPDRLPPYLREHDNLVKGQDANAALLRRFAIEHHPAVRDSFELDPASRGAAAIDAVHQALVELGPELVAALKFPMREVRISTDGGSCSSQQALMIWHQFVVPSEEETRELASRGGTDEDFHNSIDGYQVYLIGDQIDREQMVGGLVSRLNAASLSYNVSLVTIPTSEGMKVVDLLFPER